MHRDARVITTADLIGMRVLITGGLGFIGSNLSHRCVELGADVTVYDDLDPACGGNVANLAGVERHVRLIRADIRTREDVGAAVHGSDIVFNCAAYTSHAGSMKDPRKTDAVNVVAVLGLLDAIRAEDRPIRFVQLGTTTQLGSVHDSPATEEHPEFPLDVYSASKTAAEKYVLVHGTAFGIPVTAIRLSNVYGPRASIRTADLGFVNYFIGLALMGRDLTVYGDGSQVRTLTYVADVVDAIITAGLTPACEGQALFATATTTQTVRELAHAIVRQIGRGRVRSVPWPPERVAIEVGSAAISSDRIEQLTGWRATTTLHEGLARTSDYYRTRLDQYLSQG